MRRSVKNLGTKSNAFPFAAGRGNEIRPTRAGLRGAGRGRPRKDGHMVPAGRGADSMVPRGELDIGRRRPGRRWRARGPTSHRPCQAVYLAGGADAVGEESSSTSKVEDVFAFTELGDSQRVAASQARSECVGGQRGAIGDVGEAIRRNRRCQRSRSCWCRSNSRCPWWSRRWLPRCSSGRGLVANLGAVHDTSTVR
jgi:hypothetical protein